MSFRFSHKRIQTVALRTKNETNVFVFYGVVFLMSFEYFIVSILIGNFAVLSWPNEYRFNLVCLFVVSFLVTINNIDKIVAKIFNKNRFE